MISKLRKQLDEKVTTKEELFNKSVELAKKYQSDYNAFVTILEKPEFNDTNSILSGIPYALKDNFSTEKILTTANSNILSDYVPEFSATAYKKLQSAGAVLMGKATLDELAMGGTGTTGHTGIVKNPWNTERQIGGSSAGSAAAVARGIVPFALGSDTGDSIRKPAAFGGVVGFKPTYGKISRFGLLPFASSLDHVGTFTTDVESAAILLNVLKGQDELDMTSLPDDDIDYTSNLNMELKGKKLFYIKEGCDLSDHEKDEETYTVLSKFYENIEILRKLGVEVEEVSIDKTILNALYPSYMCISCAEATSNNANLNGISFGPRKDGTSIDDIMFNARTEGFSELIKRRFILGSYILQKENQEKLFKNAKRVRRMITEKMNSLFSEYDALIMPSSGVTAPKFNERTDQLSSKYLILENHLVIANFGGFPSISIPSGYVDDMPISINITGPQFKDDIVLNIANVLEKELKFKNKLIEEVNNV